MRSCGSFDLEASCEDLVRSAQNGEPRAFSELIRRYERTALAIAYSATGASERAGDVVQEAFARAWQKIQTLREPARFASWLAGIVRNIAVDERRRVKRRSAEELAPDSADPGNGPAEEVDRRETCSQVTAALQQLDDMSRSAIVLRYYEGMSSREIGELLGVSPAAVDMRLMRARQELRRLLVDSSQISSEAAAPPATT
jgi:RNA polymerase sigma-70 factor (ECF subfamily)